MVSGPVMKTLRNGKLRRKRCAVFLLANAVFVVVIFISSVKHTHKLTRLKELRINKTVHLQQETFKLISNPPRHVRKGENDVVILFWTKYFEKGPWDDGAMDRSNKTFQGCLNDCRIVTDRSYLGVSDAVVFHSRDMRKHDLPLIHSQNQVWVYLQQESPSYTRQALTDFNNVFNWTMTYRKDSEIYHPYFLTLPHAVPKFNFNEVIRRKTKLVAWIVSNCHTPGKREHFVHQLSSYIPIDIYGRCGDFSCHRSGTYGCLPEIAPAYKFYLSFENSLCNDYITEKFSRALQNNLVPIVYGGGDYAGVAPPKSFINVQDFPNPKSLADYLLLLDKSPDLYLQYFQWKTKYKVVEASQGWCNLCRKLRYRQQEHSFNERKSYVDLSKWWFSSPDGKPVCHQPSDSMLEKWNLIGVLDSLHFARRWFYKSVMGY